MVNQALKPRLLIKARPVPPGSSFRLRSAPFDLQPLFAASGSAPADSTIAQWHIASPGPELDDSHTWDLCHQLVSRGFGIDNSPEVEFVEPDLPQQWIYDAPERIAGKTFRVTASPDVCSRPDGPDKRFAIPPGNQYSWDWYQSPSCSGLADARAAVGDVPDPVTVAHLDTGYREGHSLLPPALARDLGRSFVEGDDESNKGTDPYNQGWDANPGHGTGTLSLLAGGVFPGTKFNGTKIDGITFAGPDAPVGGAPFARVIPVRIANSVVLFTTSSVARGFQYAIDQGAQVISMSMGGVPSQLWADAVNAAYQAGIVVVTAAGNNFGPGKLRIPRFIVYPARFRRVIAACGVMADGVPYADFLEPNKMAGCYGPASKMQTALSAYTPNTAWAKYVCTELIDFDGTGTSAATPQIAAAAACWLQKHVPALSAYPQPWMRAEAVRQALFSSADVPTAELSGRLGRGTLRAAQALAIAPPEAASLSQIPHDTVSAPLLERIGASSLAQPEVPRRSEC